MFYQKICKIIFAFSEITSNIRYKIFEAMFNEIDQMYRTNTDKEFFEKTILICKVKRKDYTLMNNSWNKYLSFTIPIFMFSLTIMHNILPLGEEVNHNHYFEITDDLFNLCILLFIIYSVIFLLIRTYVFISMLINDIKLNRAQHYMALLQSYAENNDS